jgi:molybdate transport system substrate-binding protein
MMTRGKLMGADRRSALLRTMVLAGSVLLGLGAGAACAAELKLISSVALKSAVESVLPDFERASGHKVTAQFGTAAAMKARIDGGEAFDVVALLPAQIDEFVRQGKVAGATRVDLARVGPALGIRVGAPKPDLSSDDRLKAFLLGVKSISHADPAMGGFAAVYFLKLSTALGIADTLKAKTVYSRPGEGATLAASGEVELGVGMMSEVVPVAGVQALPLKPEDPGSFIVFVGAAASGARDPDASRAWLKFMQSPAVKDVLKSQGMTTP